MDLEYILDLDMLSFESLHASYVRTEAQEQQTHLTIERLAAHGDKKALKAFDKANRKQKELDLYEEGEDNDQSAFLRKFGKGL